MTPYRAPAAETFRVDFGRNPKYPSLWRLLAAVCFLIPVAAVIGWLHWGGRINGSILLPAVFGAVLLFQKKSGWIEYTRGTGELTVTWRSLVRTTTQKIQLPQLRSLTVWPRFDDKGKTTCYELRLELDQAHFVLITDKSEAALEPHRRAVSDFIVEHDLLPKLMR